MPQLDFTTFAPQIIWLAITFGILYWLMARVALPRIATVLEHRRDRIASDLDEASRLKGQTDAAIAAYEQALAEARAKATAIARETRDKVNAEIEAERMKAETAINAKIAEAEARIAKARAAAMTEIGSIATDTAQTLVQALVGGKVAKADIEAAVASSLER